MAMYGLNFNGLRFPDTAPRFASRLNRAKRAVGQNATAAWIHQGLCQSTDELKRMLVQADNGNRSFHVIQRGGWIALYVGYKE